MFIAKRYKRIQTNRYNVSETMEFNDLRSTPDAQRKEYEETQGFTESSGRSKFENFGRDAVSYENCRPSSLDNVVRRSLPSSRMKIHSLNENPINTYITPLTPYLICNHFISTEIHNTAPKFVEYSIDVSANDLLRTQNYHDIQDLDIIQVQVDHFDFFYNTVLPILTTTTKRVILITSQWHLPQIHRNAKTDHVITHPNVLL
jgi:hypothetical protein